MNNRDENKLSMYLVVQKVCNANVSIWNGLPAFVSTLGRFETNIVKIQNLIKIQEKSFKGVSLDKESRKNIMADSALNIGGAVYAFASDTGNDTLKDKVSFSKTELIYGRDSILIQRCQLIKDEASQIVSSLGDYGITGSDLKDLQSKINDYGGFLAGPRTAIAEKKVATSGLKVLFHKTDVIVKEKLDKLVEQFKVSNAEFYKLYFDARIIVDIGTRHDDPGKPQLAA